MNEDHKDDKHPKAPPPRPMKKELDDDMDDAPAKPVMKQKTLATALSRAIVIATVLVSLSYVVGPLFGGRYMLVQAPNSNNSFVYRLDRLTGGVQFCGQQQCVDMTHADR